MTEKVTESEAGQGNKKEIPHIDICEVQCINYTSIPDNIGHCRCRVLGNRERGFESLPVGCASGKLDLRHQVYEVPQFRFAKDASRYPFSHGLA
jgi:hypothetical protein